MSQACQGNYLRSIITPEIQIFPSFCDHNNANSSHLQRWFPTSSFHWLSMCQMVAILTCVSKKIWNIKPASQKYDAERMQIIVFYL